MIGTKEPLHGMALGGQILALGGNRHKVTISELRKEIGVPNLTEQEVNAAGYPTQQDGTCIIGNSA